MSIYPPLTDSFQLAAKTKKEAFDDDNDDYNDPDLQEFDLPTSPRKPLSDDEDDPFEGVDFHIEDPNLLLEENEDEDIFLDE